MRLRHRRDLPRREYRSGVASVSIGPVQGLTSGDAMKSTLAFTLATGLVIGLTLSACQLDEPAELMAAQQASTVVCTANCPAIKPWYGEPIPKPSYPDSVVVIYQQPEQDRAWAFLVDGGKVTWARDMERKAVAKVIDQLVLNRSSLPNVIIREIAPASMIEDALAPMLKGAPIEMTIRPCATVKEEAVSFAKEPSPTCAESDDPKKDPPTQ
jgi:hypothetical protein